LGQGAHAPQIHLLPPQIQKLADSSDVIFVVFFEVPKCSEMQIFRGFNPGPAEEAYSAPPDTLGDGEGLSTPLPFPRTPPPLLALRASFLQVSGVNPLQNWQP